MESTLLAFPDPTAKLELVTKLELVMFSCGTKPVLVNAIVSAVNICFVHSLNCLDVLRGGGGL